MKNADFRINDDKIFNFLNNINEVPIENCRVIWELKKIENKEMIYVASIPRWN
jgi:DNA-binding cell septation regulator SpoVG